MTDHEAAAPVTGHTQARDWLAAELRRHGLAPAVVRAVLGGADTYAAHAVAAEREQQQDAIWRQAAAAVYAERERAGLCTSCAALWRRDAGVVEHEDGCPSLQPGHDCQAGASGFCGHPEHAGTQRERFLETAENLAGLEAGAIPAAQARIAELEQLARDMLGRFHATGDGHRARAGKVQVARWEAVLGGEEDHG